MFPWIFACFRKVPTIHQQASSVGFFFAHLLHFDFANERPENFFATKAILSGSESWIRSGSGVQDPIRSGSGIRKLG
ncbi:hypothetical protein L596_000230 [Steinernema carpocapsae]|uniref:Uncharacterized protein n=1 Tax=Steinernema carpocapsae TaxID=34508 RepID=A0A4U8UHP6_STECR|nr:hypothetical protein L596_000230 [Steinernema carpocapsae]